MERNRIEALIIRAAGVAVIFGIGAMLYGNHDHVNPSKTGSPLGLGPMLGSIVPNVPTNQHMQKLVLDRGTYRVIPG